MDKEEENKIVLCPEWTITGPIRLDDICILESTGQEFLCSEIIPYEGFEYLYFGSFDFKNILYVVQREVGGVNYAKIITEESQQDFAQFLFLKKRRR